jgi:hypothetical protein
MSVVAPETLRERVERYAARNPDATLAQTLGYFQINPSESSDERTIVENTLDGIEQPAASDADDETGGASA